MKQYVCVTHVKTKCLDVVFHVNNIMRQYVYGSTCVVVR
jgi:hypothetical protein